MTGAADVADVADAQTGVAASVVGAARAVARAKVVMATSRRRSSKRRLQRRKPRERLRRLRRWRRRSGGFERRGGGQIGLWLRRRQWHPVRRRWRRCGGMKSAEKVVATVRLQAAVRGAAARRRWRHVLAVLARYRAAAKAAVLAAETAATSELEAQRRAAEAAVLTAEVAAASRVEAARLEREAEGEEMAAALIRQAVRHAAEAETKAAARRLVVVEASSEDADAATQTDPAEAAEVGTQTAVFSLGRRMVAAAVQTEGHDPDGLAEPAQEVVVGRQLHPAQAKAVERAERAAERVEQLQAAVEATATRYRVEGAAAQETAPAATATTPSEVPKVTVGSGGKQRKKAQLRRQAAAEGVDVRSWAASKAERKRQLLAEAWEGMLAPGVEGLDQRIAWAQEDRRARRQTGQGAEEYRGEAAASRCFWEAARWHGEEGSRHGSRFSVLDAVE